MIFKILLILLLAHTIFYFFSKKNNHSPTLYCGLFGYIGTTDKLFNWDKFNILGRDNDVRGGDSIGRAVGNHIVKFVNPKKAKTTYEDFVINHENEEPSNIALGHTRKASVGGISEAMAQPIELDLPDNQGKFIMVHNGTIYNWRELAKKYKIKPENKTDSMVLAEIIMNNGYDVLKEYQGAAAIIIKDDRQPNTLLVFKGESKTWNNVEEERPLYYYEETNDSMYISSRPEGLYFIGGGPKNVMDFETNTLYEIFEGAIISETPYDRSKLFQTRTTTTVTRNTRNNVANNYVYDEYEEAYGYGGGNHEVFNNITPKIQYEAFESHTLENKIIFSKLRYWKKEGTKFKKLNGIFHITESGYIQSHPIYKTAVKTKVYYFYNGVMLENKDIYSKACKELGKVKTYAENSLNTGKLSSFGMHPVCTLSTSINMQDAKWTGRNSGTGNYYSGEITPLFTDKKYKFSHGDLKSIDITVTVNSPVHTKIKKIETVPVDTSTDNPPDDTPEEENPDVIKEINNCIQALLLEIDARKNDIEIMQINSPSVENTLNNLNVLEDTLLNDELFKTKKIEITHEAF